MLASISSPYNLCCQSPLLVWAGRSSGGHEERFGDCLDRSMEAIQVLCQLHKAMISEERRRRLPKVLLPSYKGLVSAKYDPTPSSILGNVSDKVCELSETASLSAQLAVSRRCRPNSASARGSGFRSRPYDPQNSS